MYAWKPCFIYAITTWGELSHAFLYHAFLPGGFHSSKWTQIDMDRLIYVVFITLDACNVAVSYRQFESKLVLWEVTWDCVDLDSFPVKSAKLYINDFMVTHRVYHMSMHIFISLLFYFGYIIGSK